MPNLAAVMLGMLGSLVLKPGAGSVHLVVDMAGYFAPAPTTCVTGCPYAVGQSNNGMLGSGGGAAQNSVHGDAVPRPVSAVDRVTAVAGRHALRADGTVWSWGDNFAGELGSGTTGGSSPAVVRVIGLTDVTAIAAADDTRYALRADGTVWTWAATRTDSSATARSAARRAPRRRCRG